MLNKHDRLYNLMKAFKTKHRRASLIIGAHSGLGFDVALSMAQRKRPIIIASHSEEKITEAKAIIQLKSGFDDIYPVHIDYTHQASLHSFIDTAIDLNIKIDCLVNAVDFANSEREITHDGIEKTMAINHFGPYLLIDQLKSQFIDHETQLILFNSLAHRHGHIDPQRMASQQTFDTFSTYCNAKLANAITITYFATLLKERGISINGFAPAIPHTPSWPMPFKTIDLMQLYFRRYLINRSDSLQALMNLVPPLKNQQDKQSTGKLYINSKRSQFTHTAYKPTMQKLIADISRKITHFSSQEWATNQVLSTKTLPNRITSLEGHISHSAI